MKLLFLTLLLTTLPADAGQWPAFLGSGAGSREAENLPLTWSPDNGVAWTTEIKGHGQSSPVCWDNKAFVTSVDGPNKETYYITCLDTQTGKVVWTESVSNSVPVKNSYYVSRAAPTPVVDGQQLVVLFESGDCVALSLEGKQLWTRNFAKDVGPFEAEFGLGASLCMSGNVAVVLLEHDGPGHMLGVDKSTGKTLWQVEREPGRSWASPAVVEVNGNDQIVVSSNGSVSGYRPSDGKVLWTMDDVGGNTSCTPIDFGNGQFLVGASPGRSGENAGAAAESNCLVEIQPTADGFVAKKQWIAKGAFPSWASPILHDGYAYWINRAGVVYCFDAKTGEEVYTNRSKQACWATPYAVGDRIYLFGKEGLVTVIAAGREYQVLAENQTWNEETLPKEAPLAEEDTEERRGAAAMFSQPTLYGYAVTDNSFLIRVGNAVICVR